MEDLKIIFSKNLIKLRKSVGLTQVSLAEKLNYSDKAVSKWERADAIPDISILKQMADFFSVSVDYLITNHKDGEEVNAKINNEIKQNKHKMNRLLISIVSILGIWLIATIVFVILKNYKFDNVWYCFIVPIPISCLLAFVFSCIWFNKLYRLVSLSLFFWTVLLLLFILLDQYLIFIIGVPIQIITLFSFAINNNFFKSKSTKRP